MKVQDMSDTRQGVLKRTIGGQSPREISAELGISVQRVHQHLKRLRKLGYLPAKESAA